MSEKSGTFVRDFDIESLKITLEIQQKEVGDVSCVIWDAAIVLAKYIEILCNKNENYLRNKKVIELGAGLGCAGLVASCFGAHVVMTDLPEVMVNLSNNIEHNQEVWRQCGGTAEAKPLNWGTDDVKNFTTPDFLLAADCVYYEESVEALVQTMATLVSEDTEVIICQEKRDTEKQVQAWKLFIDILDKYFNCEIVPLEDQHSLYSSEEIVILRARKKVSDTPQ